MSLQQILLELLLELLACAGVASLMSLYMSEPAQTAQKVTATLLVWVFSIAYRTVFLHLYVSWSLKRFLIVKRFTAPMVALSDLLLALLYVGMLSLFLPSAEALFQKTIFWVPIFSAIFIGSLIVTLITRNQIIYTFKE